jgi:hypothetical protein
MTWIHSEAMGCQRARGGCQCWGGHPSLCPEDGVLAFKEGPLIIFSLGAIQVEKTCSRENTGSLPLSVHLHPLIYGEEFKKAMD